MDWKIWGIGAGITLAIAAFGKFMPKKKIKGFLCPKAWALGEMLSKFLVSKLPTSTAENVEEGFICTWLEVIGDALLSFEQGLLHDNRKQNAKKQASKGLAGLLVMAVVLGGAGCGKEKTKIELFPDTAPVEEPIAQEEPAEPEQEQPAEVEFDCATYDAMVYYSFDSYEVPAEYDDKIERAAEYLDCNGTQAEITGSGCEIGPENYNYDLGLDRAYAVKNKLIGLGIEPERIRIRSLGEWAPRSDSLPANRYAEIYVFPDSSGSPDFITINQEVPQ